jgi:hypothetical protein
VRCFNESFAGASFIYAILLNAPIGSAKIRALISLALGGCGLAGRWFIELLGCCRERLITRKKAQSSSNASL